MSPQVPLPERAHESAMQPPSRWVPIAYLGAAFANVLFIKALALELPVAAFGAVIAALTLMLGATFAALTLQALAAADATSRRARGAAAGFTPRFDRLAARLTAAALVIAVIAYLTPLVTSALRLPSPSFAAAIPLLAATSILVAVTTGTLLGLGRERAFSLLIVLEPVLRSIATVVLFALGSGSFAPLLAMLISTTATVVIARRLVPGVDVPDEPLAPATAAERLAQARRPLHRLGSPAALLALAFYGVLVFADVVAVRLRLDPHEAGAYAGVATASRFLLLIPLPLSLLLVARVRQRLNRRAPTHPELLRVLLILAALLLPCLLVVNGFAPRILGLFLDPDKFAGLGPEYARYALAAAVFAFAQVLLFYGLAAGSISLMLLPLATFTMEVLLLLEMGTSIGNCIAVVQTIALLFLVVLAAVVLSPLLWSRLRRPA